MKKSVSLLTALILIVSAFVACGEKPARTEAPEQTTAAETAAAPSGGDGRPYGGTFRYYVTSSPTTLNYLMSSAAANKEIYSLCTTALYTPYVNEDKKSFSCIPALAAGEPVQADGEGLVWDIPIRKDCKWANGDYMSADTVVFTMKTILDPYLLFMTANSFYKSPVVKIKNAPEYHQQMTLGEDLYWEDVGVKKKDDYTVEITLTQRASKDDLTYFFSKWPMIHEGVFKKGLGFDGMSSSYGSDLENFVSSGPFILTSWGEDKFVFKKNPDYVLADLIHYDGIEISVVKSTATAVKMFKNGELDQASVGSASFTLWKEYDGDPRAYDSGIESTMFFFINTGNPNYNGILGNNDFRKALSCGIDRVDLADGLRGNPYGRIFRRQVMGDANHGIAFVDMPGADYLEDPYSMCNPSLSKKLLDRAFEATEQTNVVTEIYYKSDDMRSKAASEILSEQINKKFDGVTITVRAVAGDEAYNLRRWNPNEPTAYDINIGSLDVAEDPLDTMWPYCGAYKPARFYWSNKDNLAEFDGYYNEASVSRYDNEKFVHLCQQMEKVLLDECMYVPLFELPTKLLFNEKLRFPAERYINGFGYGNMYGAFAEN